MRGEEKSSRETPRLCMLIRQQKYFDSNNETLTDDIHAASNR